MTNTGDFELVHGSGNLFRDQGYHDADLWQAKGIVAARVVGMLDDRNLSVRKAAKETGFAAADFSRVRTADYGRFTLDRLIKMLGALDQGVEVTVQVRPREAVGATPHPLNQRASMACASTSSIQTNQRR